jgi:raffinose/stachyose/melibiose transport system substrate-binding protein
MSVGLIAGDKWLKKAINGKAKFTDKPFIKALNFTERVFKDKIISPDSVHVSYGEAPNLFAAGEAAFMIDGEWRVNAITGQIKGKKQKDIEMLVFPKIPGEKFHNTTTRVIGTGFGMNAKLKGKKAKQAWKWISFFADSKAAKQRLKEQGLMPAVKIDSSNLKIDPLVKKRMKFGPKYKGTIVLDNYIDSTPISVLNSGLQKLSIGTITVEELAAKFEQAVRKSQKRD